MRTTLILSMTVLSIAAVSAVELDYPSGRLIDYFTLLRIGGEWKIVHKSFVRL